MTARGPQGNNNDVNIDINIQTDKAKLAASQKDVAAFKKQLDSAFAPDNATVQRASKALTDQRRDFELNRREAARVTSVYQSWGKVLGEIDRANYIDGLTAELVKAQKSGKDLDKTLESIKVRLNQIGASEGEVRRVVASAAQAANPAKGAGGFGGRARTGLATFGTELKALPAIGTPLGVSTDVFGKVISTLGRLGVTTGQLAAAAPVAAAAVGLLVLGIKNFEKTVGPVIEQFNKILQARQDVAGLLATGSAEDIVSAREKALVEVTRLEAERTKAITDAAASIGAARNQGPIGQFLVGLSDIKADLGLVGDVIGDIEIHAGPLGETVKNVDNLNQQYDDAKIKLDELNRVYEENLAKLEAERQAKEEQARLDQNVTTLLQAQLQARKLDAEALKENINALNAERELTEKALEAQGLSDAAGERLQSRLRDISAELDVFNAALPEAERLAAIKKQLEDQEKAREELTALAEKAIDIETRGQERIANIREQGVKQIESAEKSLSQARAKLIDFNVEAAEKESEINRKFMKDDLERVTDFRREERKRQKEADKERLRDLEDHNNALLDAEQANDVSAFIAEQRRFETEQRRKAEDSRTELDDRLDDLKIEREKAIEARDERLALLADETAKKRADLQAEIAERENALQQVKTQIAERVKAEREAINESLRNLVTSFDTSAQHMATTVQEGFRVLAAAGINSTNAIIDNLNQRARLFSQQAIPRPLADLPPIIPINPGQRGIAFASGGIATRPTVAMVGDKPGFHEAMIPFRPSEGIAAALRNIGGGGGPVNNFDGMFRGASIGGDVTQADLQAITQAVIAGVSAAVNGQAPGVN